MQNLTFAQIDSILNATLIYLAALVVGAAITIAFIHHKRQSHSIECRIAGEVCTITPYQSNALDQVDGKIIDAYVNGGTLYVWTKGEVGTVEHIITKDGKIRTCAEAGYYVCRSVA